jgi:hypothetical protein
MYTSPGGHYIGKALKRLFVEGVLYGLGMAGYETHAKLEQLTEEIVKRIHDS